MAQELKASDCIARVSLSLKKRRYSLHGAFLEVMASKHAYVPVWTRAACPASRRGLRRSCRRPSAARRADRVPVGRGYRNCLRLKRRKAWIAISLRLPAARVRMRRCRRFTLRPGSGGVSMVSGPSTRLALCCVVGAVSLTSNGDVREESASGVFLGRTWL